MRTYDFNCCGQQLTLCLNGAALADAYDRFGAKGFLLDHIQGGTKRAFDATCWLLYKLAEQGELVRRWQGLDKRPIPAEGYYRVHLTPAGLLEARHAIEEAVRLGFARDVPDADGVDLGLAELEKKTAEEGSAPSI